jgi:hypothetical protein
MNELIREYLIVTYALTTDDNNWCVLDKFDGKLLSLKQLRFKFERVFPNMDTSTLIIEWYRHNLEVNIDRINQFLSNYRLIESNRIFNWVAISRSGKEFKIEDLMRILPNHFKTSAIEPYYWEWFEIRKYEETEKAIYGKLRDF